jgi:hypothetical protein
MKTILIFYIFIASSLFASTEYSCSHPEVCKLIQNYSDGKIKTNALVNISGDPHEFEPTTNEVKALISAKNLIVGPIELHPWLKKISYQRNKISGLKTIQLKISKEVTDYYKSQNLEALSHFWLYPMALCDLKKQLEQQISLPKECDFKTIELLIRKKLKSVTYPIILTHDALLPFMNFHSDNMINIVSLKGSGHHDEVSFDAVKKLSKVLTNTKSTWIIEKNISVPISIKKQIMNSKRIINLDSGVSDFNNDTIKFLLDQLY